MRDILEETDREAKRILAKHRACLEHIARTLLEREVIQGSALDAMLKHQLSEEELLEANPGKTEAQIEPLPIKASPSRSQT